MRKILKDKRLTSLFQDWLISSEKDREKFEFIQYDDGTIDIVDHREIKLKKQEVVVA